MQEKKKKVRVELPFLGILSSRPPDPHHAACASVNLSFDSYGLWVYKFHFFSLVAGSWIWGHFQLFFISMQHFDDEVFDGSRCFSWSFKAGQSSRWCYIVSASSSPVLQCTQRVWWLMVCDHSVQCLFRLLCPVHSLKTIHWSLWCKLLMLPVCGVKVFNGSLKKNIYIY